MLCSYVQESKTNKVQLNTKSRSASLKTTVFPKRQCNTNRGRKADMIYDTS